MTFNDRLVYKRYAGEVQDDTGEMQPSFSVIKTVRCNLRKPSGAMRIQFGSMGGAVDMVVTVPTVDSTGIKAEDRFESLDGSKVYLVTGAPYDLDRAQECPVAELINREGIG